MFCLKKKKLFPKWFIPLVFLLDCTFYPIIVTLLLLVLRDV